MMKRMIALALCAVLLVGALAACKKGGEDELVRYDYTSGEDAIPVDVDIPAGWIQFGTIDDDNRVTVLDLYFLRAITGETVAVSAQSVISANVSKLDDSGDVTSITVEGKSVPVLVKELGNLRTLYAEPGDEAEEPNTIDLTTTTAPATTTRTTTTRPLETAAPISTTARPNATTDLYASEKQSVNDSNMTPREKQEALKLLGYKMDSNGIFYVEHEPWQKQFGFNQIYDLASPLIQMVYATVRIKFRYGYVYKLGTEGASKGKVLYDDSGNPIYEQDPRTGKPIEKDWMVQMWKGRYGLVMLGGEIGVYTKPSTQNSEHYYAAVAEEELVMAMDLYQQNQKTKATPKHLFTRGPESAWWLTGFVPGSYIEFNRKSEIIMVTNIQFPNEEMLAVFANGIRNAGFREGSPGRDNPETYRTSGTSIKISWQHIDQDG